MKGKMLCVIYCVLSNLTVILFETTVLWLHPGEGMAQINGAGEEEIYGGTKPALPRPQMPAPLPAPRQMWRGGRSAPEGALGSQALYSADVY